MSIVYREKFSDSPYVEKITHGRTVSDGSPIRPAECHWHMVFVRKDGWSRLVFAGPWTTAGLTHYDEGAEILWLKFKLGTFMPHLPTRNFLDSETYLPDASSRSFWLKGSAWQFPDHENVETFVDRLVRNEVLVCDPLVDAVLEGRPQELSPPHGTPPLLAGHRINSNPHPPDQARPKCGEPPSKRQSDLRCHSRGRLLRSTTPDPFA